MKTQNGQHGQLTQTAAPEMQVTGGTLATPPIPPHIEKIAMQDPAAAWDALCAHTRAQHKSNGQKPVNMCWNPGD